MKDGFDPDVEITIRPPFASDVKHVKRLLHAAGLPTDDLEADMLAFVAEANGLPIGAIAIEVFGSIALLRSLVIDSEFRGGGFGSFLIERLEESARKRGVTELWLLTIDADAWFAKLGYEAIGRERAPAAIASTAEFSSLCPDDAVLMQKRLSTGT